MNRFSTTTYLLSFAILTVAALGGEELERKPIELGGRPAFVILPPEGSPKLDGAVPWVLYAPTFDRSLPSDRDEGWMMRQFLERGIAIAGIDVGESYGSPSGQEHYTALHNHLVKQFGFDKKASLLARSRGGLMLYNWAVENPDKVRCIAGIYPVCDLTSYPGVAKACGAYGLSEQEMAAQIDKHNPIPRLEALAGAKVPIFHIHGDQDKVVPLEANSTALIDRYKKLGGPAELKVAPGQGHNMWRGFFECQALVDFLIANATGKKP
ncbi:MAG: alpha/beta hydrolase family protein [Verrucomicrobiales bacterium]